MMVWLPPKNNSFNSTRDTDTLIEVELYTDGFSTIENGTLNTLREETDGMFISALDCFLGLHRGLFCEQKIETYNQLSC